MRLVSSCGKSEPSLQCRPYPPNFQIKDEFFVVPGVLVALLGLNTLGKLLVFRAHEDTLGGV
jgi:hypothetical protein